MFIYKINVKEQVELLVKLVLTTNDYLNRLRNLTATLNFENFKDHCTNITSFSYYKGHFTITRAHFQL